MNLEELHQYLGELITAGTDPKLPILLPGENSAHPQELTDAMIVNGPYHADPAPLAVALREMSGVGLLLSGLSFDIDTLKDSHGPTLPMVDPPQVG